MIIRKSFILKWEQEEGLIDKGVMPFAEEEAKSFKDILSSRLVFLNIFFLLGLTLRLLGLLFNGMGDVEEFVFDWGNSVRELGLGQAFRTVYGVFSYFFFGIAAEASMHLPRFWWAPYKAVEIIFEIGLFWALYLLLPEGRKKFSFWLYWINPYFILHGAWHGFWEGPHTLLALLVVLSLRWVHRRNLSWVLVGILLAASGMFKPQGLIYFVIPMGIFLIFQFLLMRRDSLGWYSLGLVIIFLMTGGLLVSLGAGIGAIPRNYLSAVTIMPNLCNDCINIWRPITRLLQEIVGQNGPTYTLRLPEWALGLFHLLSFALTLGMLGFFFLFLLRCSERNLNHYSPSQITSILRNAGLLAFALFAIGLFRSSEGDAAELIWGRYSPKAAFTLGMLVLAGIGSVLAAPWIAYLGDRAIRVMDYKFSIPSKDAVEDKQKDYLTVFLILAFSALLIPQIGTKAHSNHTYAGLVLLIPLALTSHRILLPWIAMVGIHFYVHLADFQLGRSAVLSGRYANYPSAQSLISKVQAVVPPEFSDSLLQFQVATNKFLGKCLPAEPWFSILSGVSFLCTMKILGELFLLAKSSESVQVIE